VLVGRGGEERFTAVISFTAKIKGPPFTPTVHHCDNFVKMEILYFSVFLFKGLTGQKRLAIGPRAILVTPPCLGLISWLFILGVQAYIFLLTAWGSTTC